jgi:hypothetical protein
MGTRGTAFDGGSETSGPSSSSSQFEERFSAARERQIDTCWRTLSMRCKEGETISQLMDETRRGSMLCTGDAN